MTTKEEICYYCRYSHEWGWDGLGWCLKYPIKRLVREEQTCDEYEEDSEPIDDDDKDWE